MKRYKLFISLNWTYVEILVEQAITLPSQFYTKNNTVSGDLKWVSRRQDQLALNKLL